jgi:hypothetical protein
MDFFLGRPRRAMLGRVSLGNIGLRVSRLLAERFGSDRERGIRVCSEESARLLGLRRIDTLPAGERLAWERWSPLILAVPGVASWSTTEKREAAAVILAKGGRRESDFVLLFDAHAPLRRGLLRLAAEG